GRRRLRHRRRPRRGLHLRARQGASEGRVRDPGRRALQRDRSLDRRRDAATGAAPDGEAGRARDGRGLGDPARVTGGPMSVALASRLFLPTLRDAPADAEAVSHKLLVRAGYIRQVGAGLWTFTGLGWRVHRKVDQIIREEMDAIGAQEWFAPVLTPAELWEATGRDKIPELFRVEDRAGRKFVLPLTHEETFTFHARELQSYKQLPQAWYHFQTKDRDEARPRGGLLRVREFIMKD